MKSASHVDVYYTDATALTKNDIPHYLAQLSATEQRRYQDIKRPCRRHEFLLGRAMLRQQLSSRYGTSPSSWPIEPNKNGKPEIIAGPIRPAFSISHSKGLVACAITEHGPLGLDIEQINPNRNINALATRIFNSTEKHWFEHPDTATKIARFYQLWTLKEAWAKATETGISAILKGVDLMCDTTPQHSFNKKQATFFRSDETTNTANYWLHSFNLEKNFAASLALNETNNQTTPTVALHNILA